MARFLKLNLLVVYRCIWVLLFVGMVRVSAGRGVVWQSLNSWLSFAQQQKLTFDKGAKGIVKAI